jgi:hypothetical protein
MDNELKNWQVDLFEKIKPQIPHHENMVFVLSELLNVSENSIYKRIRGEQIISIEEFILLKEKFLLLKYPFKSNDLVRKNFEVDYLNIDNKTNTLLDYVQALAHNLHLVTQDSNHQLFYAAKDLPVFYFFVFPEIAAFKFYTWKRSVFYLDEYKQKKFCLKTEISKDEIIEGKKLSLAYFDCNSIEIWCEETFNSLIRQLEYSKSIDLFEDEKDYFLLKEKMLQLIDFIETQTANGKKMNGAFEMYNHEMLLYDNSALAVMNHGKVSFITHNTSNILQINDEMFCNQTMQYLEKLIFHSVPLSRSNEKSRLLFFKKIKLKIASM